MIASEVKERMAYPGTVKVISNQECQTGHTIIQTFLMALLSLYFFPSSSSSFPNGLNHLNNEQISGSICIT